jgi:hypothetical protein
MAYFPTYGHVRSSVPKNGNISSLLIGSQASEGPASCQHRIAAGNCRQSIFNDSRRPLKTEKEKETKKTIAGCNAMLTAGWSL